jgi:hypothetical protein
LKEFGGPSPKWLSFDDNSCTPFAVPAHYFRYRHDLNGRDRSRPEMLARIAVMKAVNWHSVKAVGTAAKTGQSRIVR